MSSSDLALLGAVAALLGKLVRSMSEFLIRGLLLSRAASRRLIFLIATIPRVTTSKRMKRAMLKEATARYRGFSFTKSKKQSESVETFFSTAASPEMYL